VTTSVTTSTPSTTSNPSEKRRNLDDLDARKSRYMRGFWLRALWTLWSVEVRVLSGALERPASGAFRLDAVVATLPFVEDDDGFAVPAEVRSPRPYSPRPYSREAGRETSRIFRFLDQPRQNVPSARGLGARWARTAVDGPVVTRVQASIPARGERLSCSCVR
jgi:hypothetical protein